MIKIIVFSIDIFFDNERDEFSLPPSLVPIIHNFHFDHITVSMISASYDHEVMAAAIDKTYGVERDFLVGESLYNKQRIAKDFPSSHPGREYFQPLDEVKILEHILSIHNKINGIKASEQDILYVSHNPDLLELARQKGYAVLDARKPHFLSSLVTLATRSPVLTGTNIPQKSMPTPRATQKPHAKQFNMAANRSTFQQARKQPHGSMTKNPSRQHLLFRDNDVRNIKDFGPNSGSNTPLVLVPIAPTPEEKTEEKSCCPSCALL